MPDDLSMSEKEFFDMLHLMDFTQKFSSEEAEYVMSIIYGRTDIHVLYTVNKLDIALSDDCV